jgi:hypothetical protein
MPRSRNQIQRAQETNVSNDESPNTGEPTQHISDTSAVTDDTNAPTLQEPILIQTLVNIQNALTQLNQRFDEHIAQQSTIVTDDVITPQAQTISTNTDTPQIQVTTTHPSTPQTYSSLSESDAYDDDNDDDDSENATTINEETRVIKQPVQRWPQRMDSALPTFGGDDDEDAYRWLLTFEGIARANLWQTFEHKQAMITRYLIHDAQQWWLNNKVNIKRWGTIEEGLGNSTAFCSAFLTQHISQFLIQEWRNELLTAKQEPNEDPIQYFNRFDELVRRCRLSEKLHEPSLIDRFLQGLPPLLHDKMLDHADKQPFTTLQQVGQQICIFTQRFLRTGIHAAITSTANASSNASTHHIHAEKRRKVQSGFVKSKRAKVDHEPHLA